MGIFFPHSWEAVNPEIKCSKKLHSASIYQLHTNLAFKLQTLSKNYIGSVHADYPALKEKQYFFSLAVN